MLILLSGDKLNEINTIKQNEAATGDQAKFVLMKKSSISDVAVF